MIRDLYIKLGIIVLPFVVVVISVNYLIDPANIFAGKEYVSGIATILTKGNNVDNISNYDERLLQEQMILKKIGCPDIVVLGSSRIMEVGRDFFSDKTVLNCGVSHANIRDVISILGILDSMNKMPKEILLNVDPELICKNYTSEWESLIPGFEYFLNKYSQKSIANYVNNNTGLFKKTSSLFSLDYFQSSLAFRLKGNSKKYSDVGKKEPLNYGRHTDGTVAYSLSYKKPDTFRVANNATLTGKSQGLAEVDSLQLSLFEQLVQVLKKKEIKLSFCLLPFHQGFYDAVNSNYSNIFKSYENYYRTFANTNDIFIVGGFDPRPLKIQPGEFYDMYHCSKEAIKNIIYPK